jgi:hypothetical protein
MINRKVLTNSPLLCKNCIHSRDKDERHTHFNDFTKEEWICKGYKIVDPLDGEVGYYTCRKARQNEQLCGQQAQWFKARP